MKFSKCLSLVAVLLMAAAAAMFIRHIAADMYNIPPVASNICGIASFTIVAAASFIPDIWPAGALFMAITAKAIVRNANPNNVAGLQRTHYYAFVEDIDTYPAALTPDFIAATTFGALVSIPDDDPFVMKDGKFFHPFPCIEETGNVKSTLIGVTESHAFENTSSFSNAGNNDQLNGYIAYVANKKLIVVGLELNGTLKVVGTAEYAALLVTAERDGGTKTEDGNITKHSFRACSPVPCPTYLGALPLDPDEA
jgi:hypothetical protein